MQYANGILTKELIYQTARRLMYENGYKKTTYQMIAQKANVPVGLVNYHFKKQELLDKIYMDYLCQIQDFIAAQAAATRSLSLTSRCKERIWKSRKICVIIMLDCSI